MVKKGGKKKQVDPFTKKDWYEIKAPSVFKNRDVGFSLVNRTQGTSTLLQFYCCELFCVVSVI